MLKHIRDICQVKSGKRLPDGHDFCTMITDYRYIRARNIKEGKIDDSDLAYIMPETQGRIKKYIVKTGDIALTIAGTIGEVAYVNADFDGVNLTENAVRLTEFDQNVDSHYVFYVLSSSQFKQKMQSLAAGVAQPKLGIYKIEEIEVEIPDLPTQHRIASILSAYDDLIENNRRQIKLLEEAAQRLYREWFVELRFPGHEDVKIVDGVPEGWERIEVGTCISNVTSTKQVKTAELLKKGNIPVIDPSRNFIAGYTDDKETVIDLGTPAIVFGDHTRVLKFIPFPFAKGADGTQIIVTNNKRMPQSLFYYSLLHVDLSGSCGGTMLLRISRITRAATALSVGVVFVCFVTVLLAI